MLFPSPSPRVLMGMQWASFLAYRPTYKPACLNLA